MTEPSQTIVLENSLQRAAGMARTRLLVVGAVFAFGCLAVGVRLADLAVMGNHGKGANAKIVSAAAHADGLRGEILDRNGMLLAASLETASLYADPKLVIDPAQTAAKLVTVLADLDEKEVRAKLEKPGRFIWLARNLSPRQQQEVNNLGLPGIDFRQEERRVWPNGPLAAHVVGYTDIDGNGIAGVEKSFDAPLAQGRNVVLSLDLRLQHILEEEVAGAVDSFHARGGNGLIMDVHTGEILAMVSLPSFDPASPADSDDNARFNRNTLGVYEMGSTFKVFNTAAALDSGKVRLFDLFDVAKPLHIGRFTVSDFEPENHPLTVGEIFKVSSNKGSALMAQAYGSATQKDYLTRLGITQKPSLELPEVGAPLVPSPWTEASTMTIAYGHGLSASPVQLAQGVASVVNGGVRVNATLLPVDKTKMTPGPQVISAQTSDTLRRLMRLVVEGGTGTKAVAKGYPIAGKTGTAEKVSGKGYAQKALLSSFVGVFPAQAPEYLVLVMVDEPKGTKESYGFATGGWVSATPVGRIITRMAPMLGMLPVSEDDPVLRAALSITVNPNQMAANTQ